VGEPESALSTLHVDIRGIVQGVGFRWYVRERARALGLSGWVQNQPDGCVEVLAVGDDSALRELRSLLERGPVGARVSAVDVRDDSPRTQPLDPFGIIK